MKRRSGGCLWIFTFRGVDKERPLKLRNRKSSGTPKTDPRKGIHEMIKIAFCLRRLPGLTHDEFLRYWYETHAPLVRSHQKVLRIARYVQFHPDLGPLSARLGAFRNAPEPFDGIAEIWYENREALETLGKDPEARKASRALLEDERRFIDLSKSPIWAGIEKEIISP
jgi:EthD domain-containing protein